MNHTTTCLRPRQGDIQILSWSITFRMQTTETSASSPLRSNVPATELSCEGRKVSIAFSTRLKWLHSEVGCTSRHRLLHSGLGTVQNFRRYSNPAPACSAEGVEHKGVGSLRCLASRRTATRLASAGVGGVRAGPVRRDSTTPFAGLLHLPPSSTLEAKFRKCQSIGTCRLKVLAKLTRSLRSTAFDGP